MKRKASEKHNAITVIEECVSKEYPKIDIDGSECFIGRSGMIFRFFDILIDVLR